MLRHNRSWILFLIFVLLALAAYCFRHEFCLWARELYDRIVPEIGNCWDLSGVVVAILLILVAVLAVVLIWTFLGDYLQEVFDRITAADTIA